MSKEATITTGTNVATSIPNKIPARRINVVIAKIVDAVTGQRINNLNKRRFTTLSGQETPKKATAYAIRINNADTTKLLNVTTVQKIIGYLAAIPDPNRRYGNDPKAGANAPINRYLNLLRLALVTVLRYARKKFRHEITMITI
jgi:hypothetical protein